MSKYVHLNASTSKSNASTRPDLDPTSDCFNSMAWFEELATLKNSDDVSYKPKRGGFLFSNLDVYGSSKADDYLETFGNAPVRFFRSIAKLFGRNNTTRVKILTGFEGFVNDGEMLVVLGRPGSGCTTLLKTLAGETRALWVGNDSEISYQGITPETMKTEFCGECIYMAELDVHFAELTVLETLKFAAACRAPKNTIPGTTPKAYIEHITNAMLSIFKLDGAKNTPLGDAMIRGVSGGEKKRVSIAEAFMSLSPIQFWDNSTRGLDSATALDCVRSFRAFSQTNNATITVSLYQASQDILDCFDRVTVLYEGRQIFFGTWPDALEYFHGLGFDRPARLTTGDFLTALTNPQEASLFIRHEFVGKVPVTAEDFASAWKHSIERQKNLQQMSHLRDEFCGRRNGLEEYRQARATEKHSHVGISSPYTIPLSEQVHLCLVRGFRRLRNNIAVPISYVIGNVIMAIIVGSVFLNLGDSADAVTQRTILLFFAILINAFMSAAEVLSVWDQRPIVEKQARRALYHPVAEAISAIICDLPAKLSASILFNIVLYFMANLQQTPQAFFTFWFFTFVCQMSMSMFYRCDGSIHRTLEASMVPIGVLIMLAIIYTGFVIPIPYMKPWLSWFRHINPVAYAFESLMVNEFHGRDFECARYIPDGTSYENESNLFKSCVATTIAPGARFLNGDEYLHKVYRYSYSHLWRNLGILFGFTIVFFAVHLWSSEKFETQKPRGDISLFPRNKRPPKLQSDEESGPEPFVQPATETRISSDAGLVKQKSTLHWENVSFQLSLNKREKKTILTDIDGWVKPGTLTALMGATGAGKTSLLDVIAQRTTQGSIIGDIMVDGRPRDTSFQRSTGYAQQNDIHLRTTTVREALHFSALLRQPKVLSTASKIAYAERVLDLLGMRSYADAVVGVPGDGLSPERRKRLTIAVELAARPTTALFLDEPTSGLDSQTAFIICNLLRDLAHQNGQAIMCTIHQPSAALLGMFDQLLLIDKGKTVYFGSLGQNMDPMIRYFEDKGARDCRPGENPAEWIMDITGMAPVSSAKPIDWHETWRNSDERKSIRQNLVKMREGLQQQEAPEASSGEYATPFWTQFRVLTYRTFVEYWRTPGAVYAKLMFYLAASFMIGVSCFRSPNSLQGLQNQMFSIFLLFTTFSNILQQIVPQFAARRALFEAREFPSKTFSWQAFVSASIVVEAVWQTLLATISFVLFYYLTGMNRNTNDSDRDERATLMLLFFVAFFVFTQSLSHLLAAAIEVPQTAVNIGNPIFYLTIIFCGVLVPKNSLPRFWIFMYRVSPLTYLMRGMFTVGVAGRPVSCSPSETIYVPPTNGSSTMSPPDNRTCGEWLEDFTIFSGGAVLNPDAKAACEYCPMKDTAQFLAIFNMDYGQRWEDLGIIMAYIVFNWTATFALYWLVRVPKKRKASSRSEKDNTTA